MAAVPVRSGWSGYGENKNISHQNGVDTAGSTGNYERKSSAPKVRRRKKAL